MTLWKRQNYEDNKDINACQMLRAVTGMNKKSTEDVRAVKELRMVIQWWVHVKTQLSECCSEWCPKWTIMINHYGLQVMMTCQCRSSNGIKSTSVVWDASSGAGGCMYRDGANRTTVLSTQLFCVSKTILKINFIHWKNLAGKNIH